MLVTDIRKIVGGLLIEILVGQQGARLAVMKMIGDIGTEVSPHTTLNITNGVVVCHDLLNCAEPVSYTHLDVYKRQTN